MDQNTPVETTDVVIDVRDTGELSTVANPRRVRL